MEVPAIFGLQDSSLRKNPLNTQTIQVPESCVTTILPNDYPNYKPYMCP